MPTDSHIDVRGCKLRVQRDGRGEPLLFLHGAQGLSGWEPALAALAERFDVIAPDHPGFGRSDIADGVDDRHDRRKVRLFLTAEGRKLYDVVMPDIEAMRQIMLVGFSAAEQSELKQMLRRMRGNLSPEPVRSYASEGAPAGNGRGRRLGSG